MKHLTQLQSSDGKNALGILREEILSRVQLTLVLPPPAIYPKNRSGEKAGFTLSSDGSQKAQNGPGPADFDRIGETSVDFRLGKTARPPVFNFQEADGSGADPFIR